MRQTGGSRVTRSPPKTASSRPSAGVIAWLVVPTYNNVFGTPWNMSPRFAFNHDVQGVSPGPGGNFIKGRKQATLGLTV
jgi:hypothetical protein